MMAFAWLTLICTASKTVQISVSQANAIINVTGVACDIDDGIRLADADLYRLAGGCVVVGFGGGEGHREVLTASRIQNRTSCRSVGERAGYRGRGVELGCTQGRAVHDISRVRPGDDGSGRCDLDLHRACGRLVVGVAGEA